VNPHIIKGCPGGPEGKWEQVQAIQHEPFIYIHYNGSHWLGDEEDDIESLAAMLREHPLRPDSFSHYSVNPCRGIEDPNRRGHYIDGERLYAADGVYHFSGNFYAYSHAFCVQTNHRPTIDLLCSLMDANVASDAYQQAKAECEKAEAERKAYQQKRQEEAHARRIAEARATLGLSS
jgi:hypothetical protein